MPSKKVRLLIGVGSSNGDDTIGWEVARAFEKREVGDFVVRITRSPVEILDIIETCRQLVIVDAFQGDAPGRVWRWEWSDRDWTQQRWSGTHDFGLVPALLLAEQLKWLPEQTTLWGIEANQFAKGSDMTDVMKKRVEQIASDIEQYYA